MIVYTYSCQHECVSVACILYIHMYVYCIIHVRTCIHTYTYIRTCIQISKSTLVAFTWHVSVFVCVHMVVVRLFPSQDTSKLDVFDSLEVISRQATINIGLLLMLVVYHLMFVRTYLLTLVAIGYPLRYHWTCGSW